MSLLPLKLVGKVLVVLVAVFSFTSNASLVSNETFTVRFGTNKNILGSVFQSRTIDYADCNSRAVMLLSVEGPSSFKEDVAMPKGEDIFTCEFNFDLFYGLTNDLPSLTSTTDMRHGTWLCDLEKERYVCDGSSECAFDECHCSHDDQPTNGRKYDVFYCSDNSGCISFDKVCDSQQHCKDGSDECFCEGFVELSCPSINDIPICVSQEQYCFYLQSVIDPLNCSSNTIESLNCSKINETYWHKILHVNPLYSCLNAFYEDYVSSNSNSSSTGLPADENFVPLYSYCRNSCSHVNGFEEGNWVQFCDDIHFGIQSEYFDFDFVFICEKQLPTGERYHIAALCDGHIDCKNGADEIGCPGRFYCNESLSTEWVETGQVCDDVKDCANGRDECDSCNHGAFSSSYILIHHIPVLVFTVVTGVVIVALNTWVGYRCHCKVPSSNVGKIDRIFRLQIFFFDGLMGVYMCCIIVAVVILRIEGDYCRLEEAWRASLYCPALGVIFSVSAHGSLCSIALISVVRCLTCLGKGRDIRKRDVKIFLFFLNIANALFPVMHYVAIQDIFRTELFFTKLAENPFFSENPVNLSRLREMHKNMFSKEADIYTILKDMNNITSRKGIFDTVEIGYYGNTGLCVHDIFKAEQSDKFQLYQLLYCIVLVVLLVSVTVAYLLILREQRRSRANVGGDDAGAGGDRNVEADRQTAFLTGKVALMIGTQLIVWIPFILTAVYFQYIVKEPAPPMTFEVFTLVVIPINSFLNPVFYSGLYKKVANCVWETWRRRVNRVAPQ